MDNFQKKFLEEATDHINDLEESLLELDNNPHNPDIIEQVFRAMHSLKGGGAMFGFETVSDFTHHLETIYDYVRTGKTAVSRDILDVTLLSVDHIKALFDPDLDFEEDLKENHEELTNRVLSLITGIEGGESSVEKSASESNTKVESAVSTYYISFVPDKEIFNNGTNPLFLLDELYSLGACVAVPTIHSVPYLDEINPTLCYIAWDVFISTEKSENDIQDVFIFVEDECDLEIKKLTEFDILSNPEFISYIDNAVKDNAGFTIDDAMPLIATLKPDESVTAQASTEKKAKSINKKLNSLNKNKDNSISSIRVSSDKLDELMNLVSELVTSQARLSLFSESTDEPELVVIAENMQKLSRQLRDTAFSISLIPLQNVITRFQRLVRDLSQELGKDIEFKTEGAETELDKTIIESLTDPLMHILRNSIDHGIESEDERVAKGKSAEGNIMLKAFYSGANVVIQVIDDGKGIDPVKIKQKAIDKGLINADTVLTKKEIFDMVFMPGFSTAEKVTDVSGRGVGMDVVKRKIADIRGEVEIESEVDKGTTLSIKLPLTLSIIDGLLVRINETDFIIPLTVVDKIYGVLHQDFVNNYTSTVVLDGEQVPYHYLRENFEIEPNVPDLEQVIVVNYEEKRIGLVVDKVIGEYQAVLKPLGRLYKQQDIFSGATILGDGSIALVMDTHKIIKQFANENVHTGIVK